MFPIALQFPWGISPALLPEIPLPTKIRTAFQPAVELDTDPERAQDDDYVEAKYDEVREQPPGRDGQSWPGAGGYRCLVDTRSRRLRHISCDSGQSDH